MLIRPCLPVATLTVQPLDQKSSQLTSPSGTSLNHECSVRTMALPPPSTRRLPCILFLFSAWFLTVNCQAGNQTSNSTSGTCPVEIPGYEHHGDCNLLCHKASWVDILQFYAINYFAHAATILTSPGQSTFVTLVNILMALSFPGSGVSRGIDAILSGAKLIGKTDLQIAAKAGALCTVMKAPKTTSEGRGDLAFARARWGSGTMVIPMRSDEEQRQSGDGHSTELKKSMV